MQTAKDFQRDAFVLPTAQRGGCSAESVGWRGPVLSRVVRLHLCGCVFPSLEARRVGIRLSSPVVVSSASGLSHLLSSSLLKLVLVWAGKSLRFSVPPRHCAGSCAVGEPPGKQKLRQQLSYSRDGILQQSAFGRQSDKCSVKPNLTGLMLQLLLLSSAGAVPVRVCVSPPVCI